MGLCECFCCWVSTGCFDFLVIVKNVSRALCRENDMLNLLIISSMGMETPKAPAEKLDWQRLSRFSRFFGVEVDG